MKKIRLLAHISFFWLLILIVGGLTVCKIGGFASEKDASILNGQWISQFESYLDEQLVIKDLGTNTWAAIEYKIFHEGRKGVVIGHDDWLFTDEEFYETSSSEASLKNNLGFIENVENVLRSHGVDLIVVLVPAKADIYKQYLAAETPSPFMLSFFNSIATKVAETNHNVINLRTEFSDKKSSGALFLRTDTHWSTLGAELAAKTIAERMTKNSIQYSQQRFTTHLISNDTFFGDLASFIPLQPYLSMFMPRPDILHKKETLMLSEESTGDLFGDSQADVVLVGTSYSANPNWNFEGALKQYLETDIINFSTEGEGPLKPMVAYLESEDFLMLPPQVVVWEVPVRYLPVNYPSIQLESTVLPSKQVAMIIQ